MGMQASRKVGGLTGHITTQDESTPSPMRGLRPTGFRSFKRRSECFTRSPGKVQHRKQGGLSPVNSH
jgi:hypothetical protein